MTQPDPFADLLTRRRLLSSIGGGATLFILAPAVLGHDDDSQDDDQDDDGDDSGRGRGGDDDEVQPSSPVPAGSVEVQIVDADADAFQPGTVTIDLGGSVTWVNLDDDDHTATGAGFDTGILRPGELGTVTFNERFPTLSPQWMDRSTVACSKRAARSSTPSPRLEPSTMPARSIPE